MIDGVKLQATPMSLADGPLGRSSAGWSQRLRVHGLVILLFAAVAIFTQPYYQGDTLDYVRSVQAHEAGRPSQGIDPLWEFGHLLWRPSGWLAAMVVTPFWPGEPRHLVLTRAFMLISMLAALGTVIVTNALALRIGASRRTAFLVAAGVLFANAFLNYMGTGNAYVTGLFFLMLALHIVVGGVSRDSVRRPLCAGVVLALSALFWFPYVLVFPAVALAPVLMAGNAAERRKAVLKAVLLTLACSVALIGVYVSGAAAAGISTTAQARQWIASSSHGWAPNRNLLRLGFGVPRSFVEMQDQGREIKRYLFKDPYAPTPLTAIIPGLALAGLIWAALAAIVLPLAAIRERRRILLLLLAAAVPIGVFALFLFEAGSPERYMPLYPFLVIAAAVASSPSERSRWPQAARAGGATLLLIMIAANGYATSLPRASARQNSQVRRLGDVPHRLDKGGFIAIATNRDPLMLFSKSYPFHPLNRQGALPIYEVVEVANKRASMWRENFAAKTLATWARGGEVWVSRRVLAERPRPEWQWVEGDDPSISWKDIPSWFNQFTYDSYSDEEDGLARLPNSEENRRIIESFHAPVTNR